MSSLAPRGGAIPSLGSKLDSARAKVARADNHIRSLKQALQRLRNRDLYDIRVTEYDSNILVQYGRIEIIHPTSAGGVGLPYAPVVRGLVKRWTVAIMLTPKPAATRPLLRWGVVVGDIVHNLASALENLIWELSQPGLGTAPSRGKPLRVHNWHLQRIGFPYTEKSANWAPNVGRYLHFIPDTAIQTVLEEAQPFYAWEHRGEDPEHHPLWVLRELWNRDKHQTVNLTTTGLEFQFTNVRIPSLFPHHQQLRTKPIKTHAMRPIQGETEVAVLEVEFPHEVEVGTETQVYVHPHFALGILFGQGAPAEGDNVLDVLGKARSWVVAILDTFA